MNNEKSKVIIDNIRKYLLDNNINFENHDLIKNIKDRINGCKFTFEDNVKGMIYAQLSNQTKWINIAPKLAQIDELFFHYDKAKIRCKPASYFYDGIFNLKCGNIATKKQMISLNDNILMLEKIELDFGELDNFYLALPANEIVKLLSNTNSKYKLKYIGYALAWEFLRNVGVDGAKPDLHMRRIFGERRLGYSIYPIATEDEVIKVVDQISLDTGYLKSYIDILLWSYCADGYGEVCKANPKCHKCVIKEYCRHLNNRKIKVT